MARFERGDIVKIKNYAAGDCVVESYSESDSGPASVQVWYNKILVHFIGRDLDKVILVRESSFDNHHNLQNRKRRPK